MTIPDICPADVLGGGQGGEFSLVAGDFEEIYGEDNWEAGEECGTLGVDGESGEREKVGQRGRWGAVITCFFIDCVGVRFSCRVASIFCFSDCHH